MRNPQFLLVFDIKNISSPSGLSILSEVKEVLFGLGFDIMISENAYLTSPDINGLKAIGSLKITLSERVPEFCDRLIKFDVHQISYTTDLLPVLKSTPS